MLSEEMSLINIRSTEKAADTWIIHKWCKQTSDVLEEERSSFFGFTQEVVISSSTMELVKQLSELVWAQGLGERRPRRYYRRYDTPFVGGGRRSAVPY